MYLKKKFNNLCLPAKIYLLILLSSIILQFPNVYSLGIVWIILIMLINIGLGIIITLLIQLACKHSVFLGWVVFFCLPIISSLIIVGLVFLYIAEMVNKKKR